MNAWPTGRQRLLLLVLGVANAWSAYATYAVRPAAAILNAAAAVVLLVLAVATKRKRGEEQR